MLGTGLGYSCVGCRVLTDGLTAGSSGVRCWWRPLLLAGLRQRRRRFKIGFDRALQRLRGQRSGPYRAAAGWPFG